MRGDYKAWKEKQRQKYDHEGQMCVCCRAGTLDMRRGGYYECSHCKQVYSLVYKTGQLRMEDGPIDGAENTVHDRNA